MISLLFLVVDYLILRANQQNLLQIHVFYITFLILKLRHYRQPEHYRKITLTSNQAVSEIKECQICKKMKPPRFYHCRRCQICIFKMDHHCDWVDNCIGQFNTKIYIHLLVNVFLHSVFELIVIAFNFDKLIDYSNYEIYYWFNIFSGIYLVYESYRLLKDFWSNLKKNQTLVESYKKVVGTKTSPFELFQGYFGKNKIMWFVPTFNKETNHNLMEATFKQQDDGLETKQYIYADEYIYGTDEDDELFEAEPQE